MLTEQQIGSYLAWVTHCRKPQRRTSWRGCASLPTSRAGSKAGVRPASGSSETVRHRVNVHAPSHGECPLVSFEPSIAFRRVDDQVL